MSKDHFTKRSLQITKQLKILDELTHFEESAHLVKGSQLRISKEHFISLNKQQRHVKRSLKINKQLKIIAGFKELKITRSVFIKDLFNHCSYSKYMKRDH